MKLLLYAILGFNLIFGRLLFGQENYHLIWSDEFDYTGAPAPEYWDYDLGDHGWGNNELQNYTNSGENSIVQDGKLIIKALKQDGLWTSARLVTKNKVDFLYGRIVIRAKLPSGRGTWPAIWMMPTDREYGGWPSCGEIDIMEHVGYDPGNVHATVHTGAYNGSLGTQVGNIILVPDYGTTFHTYGMEWNEDKLDFYLDDKKYFTFNNDKTGNFATWPFDKRFHLILNIAVGGNWGGSKGIEPGLTEAIMEIDYIRLYSIDPAK
ncbi:MAG: glycoside hydrolase family 16 protein [Lentimicrobium sp.]